MSVMKPGMPKKTLLVPKTCYSAKWVTSGEVFYNIWLLIRFDWFISAKYDSYNDFFLSNIQMNSFCSKNCNPYKCYQTIIGSVSFVTKVAILYILLCSIANYFAAFEKLRSNRFCRQFASLVFQKSHF